MSTHRSRTRTNHQYDDDGLVICPLDNQSVKAHIKCQRCHILIGPAHYMKTAYTLGELTLCEDCARRAASIAKRR